MIAIARKSAFLAAVLLAAACGEKKEAPQPAPAGRAAPPPAAAPAPTGTEAAPAPSGPAAPPAATPPATAPSTKTPIPTSPSAPKPTPAPTPKATAPPATAPPAAPTPPPAAPSAHAKVGPEKCKMCHRLQYDSWAASPHKTKGLDCEGCHGNGGDYWSAAVMRDRAKATAAGLAIPDLAACRKCHGAKADAALYAKVHAHKAK